MSRSDSHGRLVGMASAHAVIVICKRWLVFGALKGYAEVVNTTGNDCGSPAIPGQGVARWFKLLGLPWLCLLGMESGADAQEGTVPGTAGAAPAETDSAAAAVSAQARNILEANAISALGLTPIQFLGEVQAVISGSIASGGRAQAAAVFAHAERLIAESEAAGTWPIRFSGGIRPSSYLVIRLLAGGMTDGLGVAYADFALSALSGSKDPAFLIDRVRLAAAMSSVVASPRFAPAADAIPAVLDALEADFSKENVLLAVAGYHDILQRLATDQGEMTDVIEVLQREATLATSPQRQAIAREMILAGQVRVARFSNNSPQTAGLEAQSEAYRERLADPSLSPGVRVLVAESVLAETGDLLAFPVHQAAWAAMTAAMAQGGVLPQQALAVLTHAGVHATSPDFGNAFEELSAAWARRLQQQASEEGAEPDPAATALLHQLVNLSIASGRTGQLEQLATIPVEQADLSWFLTMLDHAPPRVTAAFFDRFGTRLDLRAPQADLSMCVHRDSLDATRLAPVLAEMDDAPRSWLLRVVVAALPDEPLRSASDLTTFGARERRLEILAGAHQELVFDEDPEVEAAALRWFTEEFAATRALAPAFARVGAAIPASDFSIAAPSADLDGRRRIVTTWLRQSLDDGPGAFGAFLDGLSAAGQSYEVIRTVGALASALPAAFDERAGVWSSRVREDNLALFRTLLARPETDSFSSAFLGRFVATGLIYHAMDGRAEAFDAAWTGLDPSRRAAILRGDSGFFSGFGSLLRTASSGRKLDAAGMEAATAGIHGSPVYMAMCGEAYAAPKDFFAEAVAAGIATEELLCRIGPALIGINPRGGYAAEELAELQEKAGLTDAAVASWDVAISSAPAGSTRQYTRALLAKAGLLERAGRYTEALAALKELEPQRLDNAEKAGFQNTLKELRILELSEKRGAQELLQFAASGLQLQPDSVQGRLSAAAVFRALRLKAERTGDDGQAWAFGFLAAHTLRQLERDEKGCTGGRMDKALRDFNTRHVQSGRPGGVVSLVAKGSEWQYVTATPPADWMQPDFDARAWHSGAAPLGYGDGAIASEIATAGDSPTNSVATFFRRKFRLPEGETVKRVSFLLRRDDAAIVYLNGEEVCRDNLPEGPLTPSTTAVDKTSGADEDRFFPAPFSPGRLRQGENTLAVAVHQYDQDSSDLIFDAELVINDFGPDTALGAVARSDLQQALGSLWNAVPQSIRDRIRQEGDRSR